MPPVLGGEDGTNLLAILTSSGAEGGAEGLAGQKGKGESSTVDTDLQSR